MIFFLTDPNLILIAAAVIPAIALLVRVYRADRLDREPPGLLISLILLGIFSTSLAVVTERIGDALAPQYYPEGTLAYNLVVNFVVVACSEEGFKYLLLRLRTWRHPAFNCQFDGVVYAVFVSLGFALWENISYVLLYGFETALLRAVTAVPGHACFGVFMGVFYGRAKRYDNEGKFGRSALFRVFSVVFPVLLHGTYDFIASSEADDTWAFLAFIVVMFTVSFFLVKKNSASDRYI